MPDCVDHGWECTGLGHEKVINLKDLFKETEMPIPFDPTCALFLAALAEIQAANQLSLLDVRLGLEQLLDDPDFRAELTTRWNDEDPASFPLGPDESFELFRSVSDRHAELSGLQIKEALASIVDTHEFHMEALARWARFDANPWPLVVQDLAGEDAA
jgi:hypothetical protein